MKKVKSKKRKKSKKNNNSPQLIPILEEEPNKEKEEVIQIRISDPESIENKTNEKVIPQNLSKIEEIPDNISMPSIDEETFNKAKEFSPTHGGPSSTNYDFSDILHPKPTFRLSTYKGKQVEKGLEENKFRTTEENKGGSTIQTLVDTKTWNNNIIKDMDKNIPGPELDLNSEKGDSVDEMKNRQKAYLMPKPVDWKKRHSEDNSKMEDENCLRTIRTAKLRYSVAPISTSLLPPGSPFSPFQPNSMG